MNLQQAPDVAKILEAQAGDIAAEAATRLLRESPNAGKREGDTALEVWTEHLRQRVLELCVAVSAGDSASFESRVTWSRAAMVARDVAPGDLEASLRSLRDTLMSYLADAGQQTVFGYIDNALGSLDNASSEPEACTLDPGLMPERVALRYIQSVIAGNAIPGMAIVLDAVDDGLSPHDAIIRVLLPAQREVGRLWHVNEISIAEEHMVTMTTQRLMAVLANRVKCVPDSGRTAVAAAVAGNIHDVGIRAIAYLLEFAGWRTIYLGPDVPKSDIPGALDVFEADVVLLSLALNSQLPALQRTINEIRQHAGRPVKIMVGGNGLAGAPDIWREIGADGFAESAEAALVVANELVPID
jgi:methanogenic corrinoid protein MtbC1